MRLTHDISLISWYYQHFGPELKPKFPHRRWKYEVATAVTQLLLPPKRDVDRMQRRSSTIPRRSKRSLDSSAWPWRNLTILRFRKVRPLPCSAASSPISGSCPEVGRQDFHLILNVFILLYVKFSPRLCYKLCYFMFTEVSNLWLKDLFRRFYRHHCSCNG